MTRKGPPDQREETASGIPNLPPPTNVNARTALRDKETRRQGDKEGRICLQSRPCLGKMPRYGETGTFSLSSPCLHSRGTCHDQARHPGLRHFTRRRVH
jgi:hypothetical protein